MRTTSKQCAAVLGYKKIAYFCGRYAKNSGRFEGKYEYIIFVYALCFQFLSHKNSHESLFDNLAAFARKGPDEFFFNAQC